MIWLVEIRIGPQLIRKLHLDMDEVTIGRSRVCSIHLPVDTVSRRHARLAKSSSYVLLEDLQSTNGVFTGESRVKQMTLKDGDSFSIGPYIFTLRQQAHVPADVPSISNVRTSDDDSQMRTAFIDEDLRNRILKQTQLLDETRMDRKEP